MSVPETNGILEGSCLCGSVAYRVRMPHLQFVHCHCQRCRKATGTGHATNLYVERANFEWVHGEEFTTRFDLPSAASFATTFCRRCGSPLPHHTRSGRTVVVPAGSLDAHPPVAPQGRIFWESRAEWSCCDDEPTFATYPGWWR
jgi:hypothetical protein